MSNNRGDRNCLLVIQRRQTGKDAANQPLDSWEYVMRRWGKPVTATGMASVRASLEGMGAAPVRYSWRINYTPTGIHEGMRVNYHGIVFNVLEIRHDHFGKDHTDLVCEQGGNDG